MTLPAGHFGHSPFLRSAAIATVDKVIEEAWSLLMSEGTCAPGLTEEEIAGHLYGKFEQAKENLNLLDSGPFIDNESAERRIHGQPLPSGFIDFKFIFGGRRSSYFAVECKRLDSVDNNLTREYVDEGIDRFIDGKYCPEHDCAGMVGFIIDRQLASCLKRLKTQCLKHAGKIKLVKRLRLSHEWGRCPRLYRTVHTKRAGCGGPFTLAHKMLIFP